MLIVPDEFSGIRVQRDGRVCIECVVVGAFHAVAQRLRVIGGRRTEEDEVGLLVIAARRPDRATFARLVRHVVPGVVVWLAWLGNGVEAPRFLAGRGVERHDDGLGSARSENHLAPGDDRAARHGVALLADTGVPDQGACLDVQRYDMSVGRRHEHQRAVDRDRLLRVGRDVFGQAVGVLPQDVPGCGVNGLQDVLEGVNEHHAIMHQRRAQVRARRQGKRPAEAQPVDIAFVDLAQRAKALGISSPASVEPVRWRGR